MKRFKNKVALVTGGSRGIGAAIVKEFANEGATVVFTYLRQVEAAKDIESELQGVGATVLGFQQDASEFETSEELVKHILNIFGRIDILVNNAGLCRDNLLVRMSEAQWQEVLIVNLQSVFNMTRAVAKEYMRRNGGVIVNITSVMGITGNAGQSNYSASKAGVIGFTKSVALEFAGRNIRVNAVAPGFIDTDMTAGLSVDIRKKWTQDVPLKRTGTAKEVARTVLFLASEDASYITGQVLQVDGGLKT